VKRTQRVTFGKTESASAERAPRDQSHVITLCSAPVPITILRPRSPLLTRFSFFSSRHQDHWRPRYWVHMGYFPTRAEAQRWVKILLPYYPDAFVDETRTLIPHSAADAHDLPVATAANSPERRPLLS
jgi:hypothetical protein